jgi:hypothetical protein
VEEEEEEETSLVREEVDHLVKMVVEEHQVRVEGECAC